MRGNVTNLVVFGLIIAGILFPEKVEQLVDRIKTGIVSPADPVTVPDVTVDARFKSAASKAATAFAANKAKSQAFRGYFSVIAGEVRDSPYLESTADLVQLLERATDRFNAITNSPKVTNGAAVGEAINEVLAIGIGEEIQPLTPAIRESAAKAFEALEWSIQKASA